MEITKEALMIKDIIIVGAGDFGKEIAWLIEDINSEDKKYNLLGYVDDNDELIGKVLNGYKVLGDSAYLNEISQTKEIFGVISIQNARIKKLIVEKLPRIKWETIIHPSAIFPRTVEIDEGTVITAGCIISNNTKIGKHCLINLSCTVGHDNTIEDYVSVMPGCNLSGFTTLKEGSYLGTGVKTIPGKSIGKYSIVGAGAVIIKDVPSNCTAVGSPAKIIKYHE